MNKQSIYDDPAGIEDVCEIECERSRNVSAKPKITITSTSQMTLGAEEKKNAPLLLVAVIL